MLHPECRGFLFEQEDLQDLRRNKKSLLQRYRNKFLDIENWGKEVWIRIADRGFAKAEYDSDLSTKLFFYLWAEEEGT